MVALIILLIIPQTRTPIKVFVHKLIAFSPSVTDEEDRKEIGAFDWLLVSDKNEHINFKEFKGEVILVNFWATWCPPCIAEMPSLQSLYNDYGTKVRFVFVSNEDPSKVSNFLSNNDFTLPVFREGSPTPNEMQSKSIPATFVIDRDGKIVISKIGSANWNSDKVRKQLDAMISP